jgi:hypothetical protein
MFLALNLFGVFIVLRSGVILGYGLTTGTLVSRMQPVLQREHPTKFWLLVGLNLLGVLVGIFLTWLPIK